MTTQMWQYPQLWKNCVGAWCPSRQRWPSSQLQDQSPNNRHGIMISTMSAGTGWTSSQGLVATTFDGVNDYFDSAGTIADYSFIQNTLLFTLSWWQKISSLTVRMSPFGTSFITSEKGFAVTNEYGASVGTNCIRFATMRATSGTEGIVSRSPDNSLTTAWQHIAITGNGSSVAIFINGISQTITAELVFQGLSTGDSTRVLNIGRTNYSSTLIPFSGLLDDIRLFNIPIPPSVISTLSLRRGIAYETTRRRSHRAAVVTGFKSAWLNQRSQLIGGGVR